MVSDSLIELVAKSIAKADGVKDGYVDLPYWLPHAKAAIAAMGDASSSNAEALDCQHIATSPAKPGTGDLKVEGGSGEISVNEVEYAQIKADLYGCIAHGEIYFTDQVAFLKKILPYLRYPEPVSENVSLEKCAKAAQGEMFGGKPRIVAKAVLDAAGVKYAE